MTNTESDKFISALKGQGFSEHDIKVITTILEGERVYNQEDIIDPCEYNLNLLRKLGWLKKTKKAASDAELHINW